MLAEIGRTCRYKNVVNLLAPPDFHIPTCLGCGEEWLDQDLCIQIDEVLELAYQQLLHDRQLNGLPALDDSRLYVV